MYTFKFEDNTLYCYCDGRLFRTYYAIEQVDAEKVIEEYQGN